MDYKRRIIELIEKLDKADERRLKAIYNYIKAIFGLG